MHNWLDGRKGEKERERRKEVKNVSRFLWKEAYSFGPAELMVSLPIQTGGNQGSPAWTDREPRQRSELETDW